MMARLFRSKQLDRIEHRLAVLQTLIETVTRKVCEMAREQDDLNAAVSALTTAVTGAVDEIKTETQATIRNIPFTAKPATGKKCLKCDAPATTHAWFAKSY